MKKFKLKQIAIEVSFPRDEKEMKDEDLVTLTLPDGGTDEVPYGEFKHIFEEVVDGSV